MTVSPLPPPATTMFVSLVITPGLWPEGVGTLLVADNERVFRLNPDGTTEEVMIGPYAAAFDDRRGGYALVRLDKKNGHTLPTIYWESKDADPAFVWRSDAMQPLGVVDVPTLWPGPAFAMFAYDTNNVPGDTCIGYVPLRSLDETFISMEGTVLCRRSPQRLMSAAWSGRYFALAIEEGDRTWIEFAEPNGEILPFIVSVDDEKWAIGLVAMAPGTNIVAYTYDFRPPDRGPTFLVVHDLDNDVELWHGPVVNIGAEVTHLEVTPSAVVVSLESDGPLQALFVDLESGKLGLAPAEGHATIDGRKPSPPALYPARPGTQADIVVTSPLDHARVDSRVLRFEGLTRPGSTVTAGRYEATVDDEGRWSLALTLRPGSNVAKFTAEHPDGSTATTSVAVLHQPQPDEPIGMVYGFGRVHAAGWPQLYDVWTSPAVPLGLMPNNAWLIDEDSGTNVRWIHTVSSVSETGITSSSHALWLSTVAYEDRGVTAWTVVHAVPVDFEAWVRRCPPADAADPAAIFMATPLADDARERAWAVDFTDMRLVEIDPGDIDCPMYVAG